MHVHGTAGARWKNFLELRRLLRALGDEVRLNIVHTLATQGETKVTDLAEALLVSQPLVSWHLAILRRAELVVTRRNGREVYCSLNRDHYARCITLLGGVITESGAPEAPTYDVRDPSRVAPR
jgi:ArsR family transcriptional regulator, arsenate/arsenite/antimonite-responsive transcriptional repressor